MGSTEAASHGSTQPPVPQFPQGLTASQSGTCGSASKKCTEAQERQVCAQSTQNWGLPSTNRTGTPASGTPASGTPASGKAGAATGTEPGATSHGRGQASQGRTAPRKRGPGPHPPSWARRDSPAGNLQSPRSSVPGEAVQEAACVQSSSSACSWGCQAWVPPGLRARTGQEPLPGPHSPSRPPPPASPWACTTRPRPPPSPREAQCGFGSQERSQGFANRKQVVWGLFSHPHV